MADLKSRQVNVIQVRIGRSETAGIVCTGSTVSLMTQSLYDELKNDSISSKEIVEETPCEKTITSGIGKTKPISKIVKFKAQVEERFPIILTVHIVEKSIAGLILGSDFLKETKINFGLEESTFRWEYNREGRLSNFLTDEKKLKEIEAELFNDKEKKVKQKPKISNEKPSTSAASAKTEPTKTSETKKPSNSPAKKSDATKSPSKGFQLKYFPPKGSNVKPPSPAKETSPKHSPLKVSSPAKETSPKHSPLKVSQALKSDKNEKLIDDSPFSSIKDGWGTVYVATRRVSISGEPPIGFYGIWWFDGCRCNKICGLAVESETMIGLNCRGVEQALKQAYEHKVLRLRIVVSRNEGLDLLKEYARKNIIKKYGGGLSKQLSMRVYLIYTTVCHLIEKMSEVTFEYIAEDNEKSPEGIRVIKGKLDSFIDTHPMAGDEVSSENFASTLTF